MGCAIPFKCNFAIILFSSKPTPVCNNCCPTKMRGLKILPALIVLLALGSPLQTGQINAWTNSFRVADQTKPLALAAGTTYWLVLSLFRTFKCDVHTQHHNTVTWRRQKMMPLGGVATSSVKAHEQLIVPGIMRSRGVNNAQLKWIVRSFVMMRVTASAERKTGTLPCSSSPRRCWPEQLSAVCHRCCAPPCRPLRAESS